MIVFYQKGIYGYMLLESVFIVSVIYGWNQWSSNKVRPKREISFLTFSQALRLCLFSITCIIILAKILMVWTDSTIPYWDATTTVLCLFAQGLLCIKVIECWILWVIVDILTATIQFNKALFFHSAVHCLCCILAIISYVRWRKIFYSKMLA